MSVFAVHSETKQNDNSVIVYNINPYYNYWHNNFIIYVDNYSGDINDVSKNDLRGDKGTSSIYIFTKLTNGNYNYDILLNDINNSDVANNLHDKMPILVHLPKSAKNNESHALLKSDDEKGKLLNGGPYSKYAKYANGFYYKDKLLKRDELNKLLEEYKIEADKIDDEISQIKKVSIKDLYSNVNAAYMTNGATNAAGTSDAKIFLLNVDKAFSPYNLSIKDLITNDVIVGSSTKDFLPEWQVETLYIYNKDNKLIDMITFDTFVQYIWAKQDESIIKWAKSLNN